MPSKNGWPIALCALAVLFDGYDAQMLAMAIPLMAREFGVPPTDFAVAASASLAGMALGALFLSPLSDRFGRRRVLVASLLLFGLPTALAMQSGSALEVALWRLLAGCGMGATVPVVIGICTELAPAARRVSVATLVGSAFAVGASSAGLLTPLLAQWWGWPGMFAWGGFGPLVIAALAWWGIPDEADSRGAAGVAGAIPALAPASASAPRTAGLPRLGLIFGGGMWPRTLLLWALNAITLFVTYGVTSWLPTLLVRNGWSLPAASRVMSVMAIGAVAGSVFVARTVDRGHFARGFGAAYALAALALALCATNPAPVWAWAGILMLFAFGTVGAQFTLGPLATTLYPPEARATAVGWANGVGRAGSLFGPLVLAWMMSGTSAPTEVLGVLMLPLLACLAAVGMLALVLRSRPVAQR